MKPFDKILIANRGEIACRIAATAHRLGMSTVAVYSEADAAARHVALCNEAVCIGPATAAQSYLRVAAVVQAARDAGAQAVHPGYGFLSENAEFAEACAAAGLVFVGPPPAAIRAMGSKSQAKALMARAGVPLVPGYHGDSQDGALLQAEADRIGYPVLIKASAGGGGKGMRVVRDSAAFADALASCRREAAASFGDDRVLLEKYLASPRHVEIQVFADAHGHCVHLYERDCSLQRRHQKVIEEAPAPGLDDVQRQTMGAAAVAAARAVGYLGAGTVEFILDAQGRFHFMEMNTRLQVEHPVTEMILRQDLVEWQLRAAAGQSLTDWLPGLQDELVPHGHAMEVRLYAENPATGFLPSTGRLRHLSLPPAVEFDWHARPGAAEPAPLRIDAGVRQGDEIGAHYDPMIAKLIAWAPTRDMVRLRLAQALADVRLSGLHHNAGFLRALLLHPRMVAARIDTGLIEDERAALAPPPGPPPVQVLAAACARLLDDEAARTSRGDPWDERRGWRLGGGYMRRVRFQEPAGADVALLYRRDGIDILHGRALLPLHAERLTPAAALAAFMLRLGPQSWHCEVLRDGRELQVFVGAQRWLLQLDEGDAGAASAAPVDGGLFAPMPGRIAAVHVAVGQRVQAGQVLLVLEAMKMEHAVIAPAAGTVRQLHFPVGAQVNEAAALLRLEADDS